MSESGGEGESKKKREKRNREREKKIRILEKERGLEWLLASGIERGRRSVS